MHTFDLNLDCVEEDEGGEKLSAKALNSSSDEEINGFIDYYFPHGSDSDVSQSNQTPEEWILMSRSSRVNNRNEGMDLDCDSVELGLGLDLDSDSGNRGTTSLMESGESSSSSSSSMREVELVCEEDFRVLVNESNTNNEAVPFDLNEAPFDLNELPFDLNDSLSDQEMFQVLSEDVRNVENESNIYNEIQFDYNDNLNQGDAIMVDPSDNYNDEVDSEEGLGMMSNTADVVVEDVLEQFDAAADIWDDWFIPWSWSWSWSNFHPDIVEVEDAMEQFWGNFSPEVWDAFSSSSMQTVTCDVDNLPSVTLTQEELNKSNSICAICMENFCTEEKLKRFPCFHYYHVDCISPWLRTRNTCPTCRYELPIL